ncbi:F5/8 type C domain protein [compost metagenome]
MDRHGVGWFKFDESSGDVVDSKGSAVGSTVNITRNEGILGNALSFNGTSYVSFNNKITPLGKKSIHFYMRRTSLPTEPEIIYGHAYATATHHGDQIRLSPDGSIRWISYRGSSAGLRFDLNSGNKNVCDNQWHNILLTWDGTTNESAVKMYIDDMSTPVSTTTAISLETVTQTYNLGLGRAFDAAVNFYRGQLDSLEIYNEVINPVAHKILLSSNGKYYSVPPVAISTTNAIPVMTSNVTPPSGIASASTEYATNHQAWRAFNGTTIDVGDCWVSASGVLTGWLQYKFNEPKVIGRYAVTSRNNFGGRGDLKTWTIEGSSDGLNWTVLDNRKNEPAWNANETREYDLQVKFKSFMYYRINITEVTLVSASYVTIGELKMFELLDADTLYSLPNKTEEKFIQYGSESLAFNTYLNKRTEIVDVPIDIEAGKKFTHTLDMSKRRVNKILLS